MYLKKIAIINFKSCRDIVLEFEKDNPSIFIGPNDSGKTIILESIGCLLDNKKLDFEADGKITSDISNTPIAELEFKTLIKELELPEIEYDPNSIIIIGFFKIEESDSSSHFDENASNHLKWSRESFSHDDIIIFKKYSKDKNAGVAFLCSSDSTDISRGKNLWGETKTNLSSLAKGLGIKKEDIENENNSGPFKNIEVLRAIYKKIDTDLFWNEYFDYLKDLKLFFPSFRYFDSKISMEDIKGTAKDILDQKILPFKQQLITNARKVSEDASVEANKEMESVSEELFNELDSIKTLKIGVNFNIQENISDVIIEKSLCDGDIKLDSQGDGIKKQIWLSFIKWKSMKSINEGEESKKIIWCFDEPEIHLFPKAQRDLFANIKNISKGVIQSFICTHSTVFIDKFNFDSIRQVSLENSYSVISSCKDVEDVHKSLGVKNSDILFYDKFFVVEGDTDLFLIPYFYKLLFEKSIEEDNVQLISLKGRDNRKNNLNIFNQILKDFRKPNNFVYYFFDGDSELEKNDNVCIIGIYDLEDSISNKVWLQLVKNYCAIELKEEEIQNIRRGLNADSKNKFYKLLADKIACDKRNKYNRYLPSKGEKLALELSKIIVDNQEIPKEIKDFLNNINSN